MKKLLSLLTLCSVATLTSSTVVACNNQTTYTPPSWDLNNYNEDGLEHKIWIENHETMTKEELTQAFWTGMFDADDLDGNHDRQLKRFNDQKVNEHLIIKNSEEIIKQINDAAGSVTSLLVKNIEITLDQDLNSKTNQQDPHDYILKKSQTVLKGITVTFI